ADSLYRPIAKRARTPITADTGTANQHADEAEQHAAGEEGEEDPEGVEPHLSADQVRSQHIVVQQLADGEDAEPDGDGSPVRPELDRGHAERDSGAPEGPQIRHERHRAGRETDQQARLEPDEGERDRVVDGERGTYDGRPTSESFQHRIDGARLRTDGVHVLV